MFFALTAFSIHTVVVDTKRTKRGVLLGIFFCLFAMGLRDSWMPFFFSAPESERQLDVSKVSMYRSGYPEFRAFWS